MAVGCLRDDMDEEGLKKYVHSRCERAGIKTTVHSCKMFDSKTSDEFLSARLVIDEESHPVIAHKAFWHRPAYARAWKLAAAEWWSSVMSAEIVVSFINVCSMRKKVNELQRYVASRGIHILGLAETWLRPDIADGELRIPHFKLFRKDRVNQQGGGVAIYCHELVNARRRTDLERDHMEVLWIEVTSGNQRIVLGCGYRAPHHPVGYWNDLEEMLSHVVQGRQDSTVLVGDFNVDMLASTSLHQKYLHSLSTQFNLTNYVTSPTRITCNTQTLLDLYLSTTPIQGRCETVPLDISDHFAILCRVSCQKSETRKTNNSPLLKMLTKWQHP